VKFWYLFIHNFVLVGKVICCCAVKV